MAKYASSHNAFVIVISILIAMVLMLLPLPEEVRFYRPEFVVLTLIYWAMALPERVSIGVGWTTGLAMDVLMGSTFGVMALGYALAVFLISRFHLQLRQYPLWQQALIISSSIFIVVAVNIVMTAAVAEWRSWITVLTSTIIWPIIYAVLRKIRRTFQVS